MPPFRMKIEVRDERVGYLTIDAPTREAAAQMEIEVLDERIEWETDDTHVDVSFADDAPVPSPLEPRPPAPPQVNLLDLARQQHAAAQQEIADAAQTYAARLAERDEKDREEVLEVLRAFFQGHVPDDAWEITRRPVENPRPGEERGVVMAHLPAEGWRFVYWRPTLCAVAFDAATGRWRQVPVTRLSDLATLTLTPPGGLDVPA